MRLHICKSLFHEEAKTEEREKNMSKASSESSGKISSIAWVWNVTSSFICPLHALRTTRIKCKLFIFAFYILPMHAQKGGGHIECGEQHNMYIL